MKSDNILDLMNSCVSRTIILLMTCSQIMVNVPFPFIIYRKGHGLHVIWFELFKLFPVSVKKE